ncbi:hypothetical protein NA78x_001209 [Anatilimnocola sp. NA78]|uniref:hypothetical protein n=1 Tax=Anatilimnocola sp. NA78 TaxID=3415683 RepID=UPI003CE4DF1D
MKKEREMVRVILAIQLVSLALLAVYVQGWFRDGRTIDQGVYEEAVLWLWFTYPLFACAALIFAHRSNRGATKVLVIEGALGICYFIAAWPAVS